MSMSLIDVHVFDGKLIDIKIPSLPTKVKECAYKVFDYMLNNNEKIKKATFYNNAILGYKLIKGSTLANFLISTNNKYADDILANIIVKASIQKNEDIFYLTTEQLADMYTSGTCAQGRCTRLLQVYLTIEQNPIQLKIKNQ